MSTKETDLQASGPDGLWPVYVHEVAYMPGQEIPVEDSPRVFTRYEPASGYTGIEIIRGVEQRFRSLGHGPTKSELDI